MLCMSASPCSRLLRGMFMQCMEKSRPGLITRISSSALADARGRGWNRVYVRESTSRCTKELWNAVTILMQTG